MNSALLGLIVVISTGIALWALLAFGSWLVHINASRCRRVAMGAQYMPSRVLDDLRPIEDLIMDYIAHLPELVHVLAIISRSDQPQSFARIVERIQRASHQHAALPVTAHFVAAELSILMLAALVRPTRGGFVITKIGCDVQRRMEFISPSQNATAAIDNAASAALSRTGVPQSLYSG